MNAMNIELGVVPENKDYKIVADPAIARKLCKDGFVITDIKPKRGHERETIFVFRNDPGFMEKMNEYVADKKSKTEKKS